MKKRIVIAQEIVDSTGKGAVLVNTGLAMLGLREYSKAIEKYLQSSKIADEILNQVMKLESRWGLAQTYLFLNDLVNAHVTIETALQYNHNASALHGIIALRQGDDVTARGAFLRAIRQADEILSKTAEYYDALDAKGLALCGLAIADDGRWQTDRGRWTIKEG